MPGYIIVYAEIHDREEFKRYQKAFMDEFKSFSGRLLVATYNAEVLEGEWPQKFRTVIMEFPSVDEARDWYKSERYQKIAQIRHRAAKTDMILVEGLA